MNYLLQRTKQTWLVQLILHFYYPMAELWQTAIDSKKPLDFIIALWISVLLLMSFTGISFMIFQIITNPSQFENATFGIFDTLG